MNEVISNSEVSGSPFRGRGGRIIIAGGGTGGHIFPAIAIANALKKIDTKIEILFVGAKGKMEMEKVPQAGYVIKGLDIAGFNRSSLIKNISLPFKLVKSFLQVRTIVKNFHPDAVIGVGGYSSFPVLRFAQAKGIPTFIHESNSFAGKSNILLGKKATKIFVATDGMEKFFPREKIVVTGNPVRASISQSTVSRSQGLKFFSLDENKKTVFAVGGSLGAKSINEAISKHLDDLLSAGLQLIWQTGKPYAAQAKERVKGKSSVWVNEFITQMDCAYAAADIVVSRAGAMAIAELCVVKKPVLFVPYPHAAEDHQTVNAKNLVSKNAAWMVKDSEALDKAVPMIIELANDENKQNELKKNIGALAITDADRRIAEEILNTLKP
ncbi:MAG TPA: undecaprenyldiphospho-muramoylpentapeptide beta-N-acetylglucosaminyltransferase [Chitinophagaceae bacterium]|jgi:UDP-N-acetylglucosamine--N-acetylmuramyl-(pentapeptide) pyrophosphoryl-undecaprenol N-acetylglucosamine transferase|nr:undecaprenyldiphospho-muramoylpentapeptide beta-N-acetylglucosaminyltransferase [Chitinophagaceae bacterium]